MPVPSRANAPGGGKAETWCIRDRAGVTSEICAFSSADDCIRAALVGPAGGTVCAPQTRRSFGKERRVASPTGNFRPRFGHAAEAKRKAIEEGKALRADAVKPLENLDLHRKSNPNFVPAGGQI